MDKLVDTIIKLNLDEIESYDFPLDVPFGLDITHEDVRYCFIIKLSSNNKNLICFGPGAHKRDAINSKGDLITPPYFHRWSWFKYFDESFIAYSDPVYFYDETITIGWLVGNRNSWYLEVVSQVIKKIAKNQKIYPNNMLFYSSSGGGYTSICLGTLIKGSKVLVNNAQFNILRYNSIHLNNLFNILEKDFPELTRDEIEEILKYRLHTIELFKRENYVPPITYYVNIESGSDMRKQFIPFINELKELPQFNNDFIVHFYREVKEKPHNPMPPGQSLDIIKEFAKQHLYNSQEPYDNS